MVSSLAPVGVGVGTRAELDAQRRALQRQTLAEPAFQEAPVAVAHLVERTAVDDDDRRILSPLVRIAQLGSERAVARRLLVQHGRMQHAGELGCGELVKIEIITDSKFLFPDNAETIKACEALASDGFVPMPYMFPDLNAARAMLSAGASCIMPLAAPIGSNQGLVFKDIIEILINELDTQIIVDAGIGRPSQACEAMEMGAAAIMANTAIASSKNIPLMARAFKEAIIAGRNAYLAGLGTQSKSANASSPLTGFLD